MNDFDESVYYKIYYYEPKDYVTVICMQWFDERHYIEHNFYVDKNNKPYKFDTEDEAIDWLNNNVISEKIDPHYRSVSKEVFNGYYQQNKYMKKPID
jgi:hypothetical protein